MGLKKSSRRLLKLGRQAAREMGEGGRDFVDTVFRTATQVLEEAIRRGTSKVSRPGPATSKRSKATASTRGRRPSPRAKAGKVRSIQVEKAPVPSHRQAVQRSRASRAAHPPATTAPDRPRRRKGSSAPSQRPTRRPRAPRPPRAAPAAQEHFESPAPAAQESTVTAPADGSLV